MSFFFTVISLTDDGWDAVDEAHGVLRAGDLQPGHLCPFVLLYVVELCAVQHLRCRLVILRENKNVYR